MMKEFSFFGELSL